MLWFAMVAPLIWTFPPSVAGVGKLKNVGVKVIVKVTTFPQAGV